MAKGENTSMIKSPVITGQGFTYDGNLVIECDNHVVKKPILEQLLRAEWCILY